ncbi:MAG: glycosyltransferase family 2 protein [Chloroflexota bacterium]
MNAKLPSKVTIGLPVYNGEPFLHEAIESVLQQGHTNFELIISDNGSTDRTETICREFAEKDERIRYYRSDVNRGASWNYNRTFELATGEYFRWLAADDYLAPTLLEKSVTILENHPEVVLAFSWVVDIDADGRELEVKRSTVNSTRQRPNERFRGLSEVRGSHNCEEVFGLIRKDILACTKLIDNYTDSDRTLLAELGLHGPFHEIAESLFYHRLHEKGSVTANPTRHMRAAWFDPKLAQKLVFPNWRQLYEMLMVPLRVPISLQERLLCYKHLFRWTIRRRQHLRKDLVWASRQLLGYS